MFGLGLPEMIVILVIAVVFFGPKRLPGLGKSMGEAIKGFRQGMTELPGDAVEKGKIKED
jgi:sec-independent protein translocase protein TatA